MKSVNKLDSDEYRQVARLHIDGINKGFLSSLGVNFLALLYECIDRSDSGVLIVVKSGGRVVGFVSGAAGIGPIYRMMLRSYGRLFLSLFPVLFSPKKIFRIVETVVFSRGKAIGALDLPDYELLSIAVDSNFRGGGYAKELFGRLVGHCSNNGIAAFKIVVGDALAPAHRFYQKMGAYPIASVEVHKGSGSVVYRKDVE